MIKADRLIATSLAVLMAAGYALAESPEEIHLENGSVLHGYISQQVPGMSISVMADDAVVVVNSDTLRSSAERNVPVTALSPKWQDYVAAQMPGNPGMLPMSTLTFDNSTIDGVYIIETGDYVKFVDMTPRLYTFPWNQLAKTLKTDPSPRLTDKLYLADGSTVSGQIVEQTPGSTIKLRTDDGRIRSVKATQVTAMETVAADGADIIEISPRLDVLTLRGGQEVTGVVTRRNMGRDMTVITPGGQPIQVQMRDVTKYAKADNPQYSRMANVDVPAGAVMLNGADAYFFDVETAGEYIVLNAGSASIQTHVDEPVDVYARIENANSPVSVVKAYRAFVPGQGKKAKDVQRMVVTYRDVFNHSLPYERDDQRNGVTHITYTPSSTGDYLFFIPGHDGYIIVNVIP